MTQSGRLSNSDNRPAVADAEYPGHSVLVAWILVLEGSSHLK